MLLKRLELVLWLIGNLFINNVLTKNIFFYYLNINRMLRRMSSSLESNVPNQVSKVLKTLNEWNFEVFAMNDCSDGQALRYLGYELMQKYNILSKFKVVKILILKIQIFKILISKHKKDTKFSDAKFPGRN